MYRPEARLFGVVRDVGFCTEGEVDWVIVDASLDIEAVVECVVYGVWDGPWAVEIMLRLELVVVVESGFCNLIVCNVYSGVYVCEFR